MTDQEQDLRVSMNEIDHDSLRAGMSDDARLAEALSRFLLGHHLVLYFSASEAARVEIVRRLDDVVARDVDVPASTDPHVLEWRREWPRAARAAILALWRTPRHSLT
jgi:hypothetical protein